MTPATTHKVLLTTAAVAAIFIIRLILGLIISRVAPITLERRRARGGAA